MSDKINWGIIGCGHIASKFAEDLLLSKKAVLAGVASRTIEKAKNFGEKYQAHRCYGSYEELAHDPNIDVVYIATPHTHHFENTMLCLKNSKGVLCEKPMGMDSSEVELMIAEAKRNHKFLMEAIWTRFLPATEKLLEHLNQKVIGEISSLTADFGFVANNDPEARLYNKKLGGGSLMDVGLYPVYLSLITMGMPSMINATANMTETAVDADCKMNFAYVNRANAYLESSIKIKTPTEAVLQGTLGSIKMHSRFLNSKKITVEKNGVNQDYYLAYIGNGYWHEIEEVNSCLLANRIESEKLSWQTSLELSKILDKVKEEIGLTYS